MSGRGVAILAAVTAVVGLGGCARAEPEIRATIEAYERALRDRDVAGVCELVVPRALSTPSGESRLPGVAQACRESFDRSAFDQFAGVDLVFEQANVTAGRAKVAVRTSNGRRLGFDMARLNKRWRIVRPDE